MRETAQASKVIKELRKYPKTFVINIAGGMFQQAGLPDSLIIHDGIHIFVEFKGPDTAIEPLQLRIKQLLTLAGANVFIVRFNKPKQWTVEGICTITFDELEHGVKGLLEALIKLTKGANAIFTDSAKS